MVAQGVDDGDDGLDLCPESLKLGAEDVPGKVLEVVAIISSCR